MKKIYSLLLAAMLLLPGFAMAENMAIEKTRSSQYDLTSGTVSTYRLGIPLTGAGIEGSMNGTESYTFASWTKPSQYGVFLALAPENHMNSNGNWVISTDPNGKLTISGHSGTDDHGAGTVLTGVAFTKGITMNEWNYVAVVVDNENQQFTVYINGEVACNKRMTGKLYFPSTLVANDGQATFQIGAYGMTILIDEAQLFNKALSAEEVAQAQEDPTALASLTGHYTFDEKGTETGHFPNVVAGATSASDAIYNLWTGSATTWGGWVSGTNEPADATLVAGRTTGSGTTDPTEVETKDFTGLLTVKIDENEPDQAPGTVVHLIEMSDGTYTFKLDDFAEMGAIVLPGITRDGDNLSGHIDGFELLGGTIKANIDLTGTYNGTSLDVVLDIQATEPTALGIKVTFTSDNAAIGSIAADNENAPVEYYNLQGVRVAADQLGNGFYVRRQGTKVSKVLVK